MAKSQHNPSQQVTTASPWIYTPWLDLIVGCGAWSAPLLLISYFSIASSARAWAMTFYALAIFFNYPHYMATIYRAYHRAEDFHKYRIFTVHITALIVLTLVLAHSWARILPWIFTIYLTWSPWHYSGQNYGLFMMFARRAGAKPSETTRRALYGAFIVSYLVLFLGFHTGSSADPLFISLGIPASVSRWEQLLLVIAFFALTGFGLGRVVGETGWRKLIPGAHLVLFAVSVVPVAGGNFAHQGSGNPPEPVQYGRAGRDALGAILVDYQLLRAARDRRRKRPQLAPMGLLLGAVGRRNCVVCPRTVAGEPRLPS